MTMLSGNAVYEFALARSAFLDAHSEVEKAVNDRLKRLKLVPKQLLGQNLETLGKAEPAPQLSKAAKAKIDATIPKIKELQETRHAVVHGKMASIQFGTEQCAAFANPQRASDYGTVAILLTQDQFAAITKALIGFAKVIKEA